MHGGLAHSRVKKIPPCARTVIAKSRHIRTLHATARFVIGDVQEADRIRAEGPSVAPSKIFGRSRRFLRKSEIQTCIGCLIFENEDGETIWQGGCKYQRRGDGKFRLTHSDAWQDPASRFTAEGWQRTQTLAHLSKRPSQDRHLIADLSMNHMTWDYFSSM